MIQLQPTTTKSTSFRSCALLSEYNIWITFKPLCLNVPQVHKHVDSVYSAWATKEISEKGNINMSRGQYVVDQLIDWVFLPCFQFRTLFCLPRSRGVPTSFLQPKYCMFGNRGTPQYYSSLNQIKAVNQSLIWDHKWGPMTYLYHLISTTFWQFRTSAVWLPLRHRQGSGWTVHLSRPPRQLDGSGRHPSHHLSYLDILQAHSHIKDIKRIQKSDWSKPVWFTLSGLNWKNWPFLDPARESHRLPVGTR